MIDDPNKDLISQLARRPSIETEAVATGEVVIVPVSDWNSPIDTTTADSMTLMQVIRGEFVEAKERAAKWAPRPMPDDWQPHQEGW